MNSMSRGQGGKDNIKSSGCVCVCKGYIRVYSLEGCVCVCVCVRGTSGSTRLRGVWVCACVSVCASVRVVCAGMCLRACMCVLCVVDVLCVCLVCMWSSRVSSPRRVMVVNPATAGNQPTSQPTTR